MPAGLKPVVLVVLPSIDWPAWALWLQAIGASAGAVFFSWPATQQWLVWAMLFDLVAGSACGVFTRGGLHARLLARGMTKKCGAMAVVWFSRQANWKMAVGSIEVDVSVAVALWYLAAEGVSIMSNLDELDIPLPAFVRRFISESAKTMRQAGIAPSGQPRRLKK